MSVSCRNGMSMSGAICAGYKPATCDRHAVAANGTIHPARQARHLSLGICHSALDTQTRHTAHGPLAEPQQTMAEASASGMMHRAWGVGLGVGVAQRGVAWGLLGAGLAWSLELGAWAWSLELGLGAWSLELGARSSELWLWLWLGNTTAPICVLAITIPYIICKPGCAGTVRGSCWCFIISPTV